MWWHKHVNEEKRSACLFFRPASAKNWLPGIEANQRCGLPVYLIFYPIIQLFSEVSTPDGGTSQRLLSWFCALVSEPPSFSCPRSPPHSCCLQVNSQQRSALIEVEPCWSGRCTGAPPAEQGPFNVMDVLSVQMKCARGQISQQWDTHAHTHSVKLTPPLLLSACLHLRPRLSLPHSAQRHTQM